MQIKNNMPDSIVLEELGQRISSYRLNKNMTQKALAKEAGVSLPTIQRIENGASTNLTNFIRLLRALKLLDNIAVGLPAPPISPLMQVRSLGKTKHRASTKQEDAKEIDGTWTWESET